MVTIEINFRPSLISDNWLADLNDLQAELKKLMPEVKRFNSYGFKQYKWYRIQDVCRCIISEATGEHDCSNEIEIKVIPKNL